MSPLFDNTTDITGSVLNAIAHMPTTSLFALFDDSFSSRLTDADCMYLAVLLAQKSYNEGGCPIGAVIVHNSTRRILGKGHNTLVQENHPYNHGETSAIRDAGRQDFSATTLFTSLSPCQVCATLLAMRGFSRVVIGDTTNASGTEAFLRDQGVQVDILEDARGIALYETFRRERPALEREDWQGLSGVKQSALKGGNPRE
ncbi:MAG: nucleoside deaminase [Chromatocurvus sp.]